MSRAEKKKERELLSQIARGDETAFRELYVQWQPHLASFIFGITKSKELTAEIIQDVFLKIWLTRNNLAAIENFKSYLFVIARNQAVNAFQKTMREIRQLRELEKTIDAENQEDELLERQLSIVDQAIDQLSPRQKEIYLLHRHEKLTYQQIADQLGISKESVKTHLKLAVRSITRYLQNKSVLIIVLIEVLSKKI